jgi:hypothetical protein
MSNMQNDPTKMDLNHLSRASGKEQPKHESHLTKEKMKMQFRARTEKNTETIQGKENCEKGGQVGLKSR